MQQVGGEANLKFLLQVGWIWASKDSFSYGTQVITKFLKAFNIKNYVHLLFEDFATEIYRHERDMDSNTWHLVNWLK